MCARLAARLRLLGDDAPALVDADGFVDTGDMIEVRGDRCYFVGRRGGVINVGGAKVHPEEVEAVLNSLAVGAGEPGLRQGQPDHRRAGRRRCRAADPTRRAAKLERDSSRRARRLPAHMAPARIRFVADLPMTDAGKLSRHG